MHDPIAPISSYPEIGGPSSGTVDSGWGAVVRAARQEGLIWRPDELPSIWRHQLRARIELAGNGTGIGPSCGEILSQSSPSIEALKALKEFGKSNCNHPESLIPGEISRALYYLSILAARIRLGTRITKLSDPDLRRTAEWLSSQSWLDPATRAFAEFAISLLNPRNPPHGVDPG